MPNELNNHRAIGVFSFFKKGIKYPFSSYHKVESILVKMRLSLYGATKKHSICDISSFGDNLELRFSVRRLRLPHFLFLEGGRILF